MPPQKQEAPYTYKKFLTFTQSIYQLKAPSHSYHLLGSTYVQAYGNVHIMFCNGEGPIVKDIFKLCDLG